MEDCSINQPLGYSCKAIYILLVWTYVRANETPSVFSRALNRMPFLAGRLVLPILKFLVEILPLLPVYDFVWPDVEAHLQPIPQ